MNRLKSGIIGLGFIGPSHMEALRRTGLSDIAAIADINLPLAEQIAARYHVPKVFADYRELLADPEIDMVHICAPNYLHFEIAKAALERGKHVICEKPLVFKIEEADELVKLADSKKKVAVVSFNLRYYPLVQQAREMIKSGKLGSIYAYHGTYLQDWLLLETDYSWRLDPKISGPSRAFGDIGSHWIDMAEYVTGKHIKSVCADKATFLPHRKKPHGTVLTFQQAKNLEYDDIKVETEDYMNLLFRFEDGARGSLIVSQVSAGKKNSLSFEADGSRHSLSWNSEEPNSLWIGHREKPNEVLIKDPDLLDPNVRGYASFPGGHAEGFPDTSKQLFFQVYDYILRGGPENGEPPSFPTFEDGAREVRICNAVLKSCAELTWVEV